MSLTSNKENILREVGLAFSEGVRKAIMGEGFSPVNISLRASVPTPVGLLCEQAMDTTRSQDTSVRFTTNREDTSTIQISLPR